MGGAEKLADFDPLAQGAAPADDFAKFSHFRFSDEAQAVFIEWSEDMHQARIPNEDEPLIRHATNSGRPGSVTIRSQSTATLQIRRISLECLSRSILKVILAGSDFLRTELLRTVEDGLLHTASKAAMHSTKRLHQPKPTCLKFPTTIFS